MSGNNDNANVQTSSTLTSERLHNMVLDHMLENGQLFILGGNPQINPVDHFKNTLDCLVAMAHKIASESLVNRQHLSPLPTFDGSVDENPDNDDDSAPRYELRYRIVEQIGDESPYKDSVLSAKEAEEIYGDSFIDNYWGRLGEHCPRRVTTSGNRNLWFTVVRYPVLDQPDHANKKGASAPGMR